MTNEQAEMVIKLKNEIDFASNQILGMATTLETLKSRPDMQKTLKMDLTLYAHDKIPIARVAIPADLLNEIAIETREYWLGVKAAAISALEQM